MEDNDGQNGSHNGALASNDTMYKNVTKKKAVDPNYIKKTRKSRKQENQCFSQFYRLTNSNNSNYIGLMLG